MDPEFIRPTRSLEGRVAVVSGAGAAGTGLGNGRACAILLAEAGARVICADISLPSATVTADMITTEFGPSRALAVQCDATSESSAAALATKTLEAFGRIDILVNVVGIAGAVGTAETVSMAEWAKGMEVNVGSMVVMSKACVPIMARNEGQWRGSIVNLSSVAGLRGGTPSLLYPTSKGAIVNLTRAMAAHHASQGIRVNCVCPGMVYTPMMSSPTSGPPMTAEAREIRKNRSLLKTEGNGWDVAAAVRFLAGDEARWMTGVILPVDAGATCATSTDVPGVGSGT
ncbi:hypothetical protein B0A48_15498 [Cryoendolithus antarcticus]|uniref:Uncharacterized protein n=1 Tax=Cryoendolithus antarcticus TaxID=1507870 RepID=A0A1V8SGD1_9PEZI|nr:hypothetical protein B0A48_15498 [Cryoendolithus antarcticus]